MNQSPGDSQTNWRYILIALIWAVLVGGWTFYYAYGTATAEVSLYQGYIAQQTLLIHADRAE